MFFFFIFSFNLKILEINKIPMKNPTKHNPTDSSTPIKPNLFSSASFNESFLLLVFSVKFYACLPLLLSFPQYLSLYNETTISSIKAQAHKKRLITRKRAKITELIIAHIFFGVGYSEQHFLCVL